MESVEGLFFDVKGVVQSPARVTAFVRYVPDPRGDRQFNPNFLSCHPVRQPGARYRKIYDLPARYAYLREHFPHYIYQDEAHDFPLQGLPRAQLATVYDPRESLALFRAHASHVPLYRDALDFLEAIRDTAKVPFDDLGMSGSLLVGLEDPARSDYDVLVYGERSCRAVHAAIPNLVQAGPRDIHFYTEPELREHFKFRGKGAPISFAEFQSVENQKTHQGKWRGRDFFIRYVKYPWEQPPRLARNHYKTMGRCRVTARVTGAEDRIFTPCKYHLEEVRVESLEAGQQQAGSQSDFEGSELNRAVSFRGKFCEQARAGDRVVIEGTLEEVTDPRTKTRDFQLVLGTEKQDFFLPDSSRVTARNGI